MNPPASAIAKIADTLARAFRATENTAASLVLAAIIILSCLQIALRDLFQAAAPWIDPLVRYLVVWAGMFGAIIASREGQHITIDLVSRYAPAKVSRLLAAVLSLGAGLVCLMLFQVALRFVRDEMAFGGSELLGVGSWFWLSILPVSFLIMAGRFFGRAIGLASGRLTPAALPIPPDASQ